MAIMLGKLYDALRAGSVPDDKAREAAEEVAGYDGRLAGLERRLDVLDAKMIALQAMVGINLILTIGVLARLLTR